MQRMTQFGPFTMPDCVPEDGNRKARASAQPGSGARVCVSAFRSPARGDRGPAAARDQRARAPGIARPRARAAARQTRDRMRLLPGWPAPDTCSPQAALLWAPALQCTPQIALTGTLYNSPSLYSPCPKPGCLFPLSAAIFASPRALWKTGP